jgi:ABC-type lipoprotein export system ATPase subunit
VLAGEPTGNPIPITQANCSRCCEAGQDQQRSRILVTHSIAAAQATDRVYLLTAAGIRPLQASLFDRPYCFALLSSYQASHLQLPVRLRHCVCRVGIFG